jgi:hypothetical protein
MSWRKCNTNPGEGAEGRRQRRVLYENLMWYFCLQQKHKKHVKYSLIHLYRAILHIVKYHNWLITMTKEFKGSQLGSWSNSIRYYHSQVVYKMFTVNNNCLSAVDNEYSTCDHMTITFSSRAAVRVLLGFKNLFIIIVYRCVKLVNNLR